MTADLYTCHRGHVCLTETYTDLGYCPYCELSPLARATWAMKQKTKETA